MKFIMAVIKPQRLDPVREALNQIGVTGMTVTEVRGFGRQKGHREVYRGTEYNVDFVPKIKIEIATPTSQANAVMTAICDSAGTGAIGDGKIFVVDLEEVVRVRTGEAGPGAL